jgi:hypothetical protein
MRSGVIVIEPTLRSQRPAQLPPVISVQSGVTKQGSTPSAAAIAAAASMSKPVSSLAVRSSPLHLVSAGRCASATSSDCGG